MIGMAQQRPCLVVLILSLHLVVAGSTGASLGGTYDIVYYFNVSTRFDDGGVLSPSCFPSPLQSEAVAVMSMTEGKGRPSGELQRSEKQEYASDVQSKEGHRPPCASLSFITSTMDAILAKRSSPAAQQESVLLDVSVLSSTKTRPFEVEEESTLTRASLFIHSQKGEGEKAYIACAKHGGDFRFLSAAAVDGSSRRPTIALADVELSRCGYPLLSKNVSEMTAASKYNVINHSKLMVGGGMKCSGYNVLLWRVFMHGCIAAGGGAIVMERGDMHVYDSVFESNTALLFGGGALLVFDRMGTSTPTSSINAITITHTTFVTNTASCVLRYCGGAAVAIQPVHPVTMAQLQEVQTEVDSSDMEMANVVRDYLQQLSSDILSFSATSELEQCMQYGGRGGGEEEGEKGEEEGGENESEEEGGEVEISPSSSSASRKASRATGEEKAGLQPGDLPSYLLLLSCLQSLSESVDVAPSQLQNGVNQVIRISLLSSVYNDNTLTCMSSSQACGGGGSHIIAANEMPVLVTSVDNKYKLNKVVVQAGSRATPVGGGGSHYFVMEKAQLIVSSLSESFTSVSVVEARDLCGGGGLLVSADNGGLVYASVESATFVNATITSMAVNVTRTRINSEGEEKRVGVQWKRGKDEGGTKGNRQRIEAAGKKGGDVRPPSMEIETDTAMFSGGGALRVCSLGESNANVKMRDITISLSSVVCRSYTCDLTGGGAISVLSAEGSNAHLTIDTGMISQSFTSSNGSRGGGGLLQLFADGSSSNASVIFHRVDASYSSVNAVGDAQSGGGLAHVFCGYGALCNLTLDACLATDSHASLLKVGKSMKGGAIAVFSSSTPTFEAGSESIHEVFGRTRLVLSRTTLFRSSVRGGEEIVIGEGEEDVTLPAEILTFGGAIFADKTDVYIGGGTSIVESKAGVGGAVAFYSDVVAEVEKGGEVTSDEREIVETAVGKTGVYPVFAQADASVLGGGVYCGVGSSIYFKSKPLSVQGGGGSVEVEEEEEVEEESSVEGGKGQTGEETKAGTTLTSVFFDDCHSGIEKETTVSCGLATSAVSVPVQLRRSDGCYLSGFASLLEQPLLRKGESGDIMIGDGRKRTAVTQGLCVLYTPPPPSPSPSPSSSSSEEDESEKTETPPPSYSDQDVANLLLSAWLAPTVSFIVAVAALLFIVAVVKRRRRRFSTPFRTASHSRPGTGRRRGARGRGYELGTINEEDEDGESGEEGEVRGRHVLGDDDSDSASV